MSSMGTAGRRRGWMSHAISCRSKLWQRKVIYCALLSRMNSEHTTWSEQHSLLWCELMHEYRLNKLWWRGNDEHTRLSPFPPASPSLSCVSYIFYAFADRRNRNKWWLLCINLHLHYYLSSMIHTHATHVILVSGYRIYLHIVSNSAPCSVYQRAQVEQSQSWDGTSRSVDLHQQ